MPLFSKNSTYSVFVWRKSEALTLSRQFLHPSVISFQSIGSLYMRYFNWRRKAFNWFQNRAQWYWIQSNGKSCLWNLRCEDLHGKCVNLSVPQRLSSSYLNTVVYWSIIHYPWISLCGWKSISKQHKLSLLLQENVGPLGNRIWKHFLPLHIYQITLPSLKIAPLFRNVHKNMHHGVLHAIIYLKYSL